MIPFNDVIGSGDKVAPEQIGETVLNIGAIEDVIVTSSVVVVVAHCPASGVKV